jgi:hypothetical protein
MMSQPQRGLLALTTFPDYRVMLRFIGNHPLRDNHRGVAAAGMAHDR